MEIKEYAGDLAEKYPAIKDVIEKRETLWINPNVIPFHMIDGLCQLVVSDEDIEDAGARLDRFAPFIKRCFPETEKTNGLIESPLRAIPKMQEELSNSVSGRQDQTDLTSSISGGQDQAGRRSFGIPGTLMLKMDSHLAIAGSVKARGGIYEVLKHAEDLAISEGKITVGDNYEKFDSNEMRDFLSGYTMQVGSTGNLGLSIGIMSAFLGFKVKVHMSCDAKQWKKDMLRSKGVEVIEYEDDYSKAVAEGRRNSDQDPKSHFVDDEQSLDLFLGYAVAAKRLKEQLDDINITVDQAHPLIVYIPAGVGGAPGGVGYGLKRVFGDDVHVFYTEPVECPSLLAGFASGLYEKANVSDFGLSCNTHADGLACASPSGLVTRLCGNMVSGDMTIDDARLYDYMRMLMDTEDIRIEPSSCASFAGPVLFHATENGANYRRARGMTDEIMENATHICWATGGALVPEEIWQQYLETYI